MQSRVLIVDDDAEMREALEAIFSAEGYGCRSRQTALRRWGFDGQTFDVVVCDLGWRA